ncbi:unnamed protein product [Vitrella brassicaformis CCMP3155]|uniref:Uncharacterized protein n=1 Tax=Vitrella brassicaformis (strain CCMP3155) TaxID=1169540 RepID=A0A0G4FHZ8_VITBC|nr:unnamed protein product [Vitrella brassicaformis CCMP3155]|eukprot:CEM12956.1 unnamed protein product [Vitrella brassicaformis CCMP3155]
MTNVTSSSRARKKGDTVVAHLSLYKRSYRNSELFLFTSEAEIEGQERLDDRYPIAMPLARRLLTNLISR